MRISHLPSMALVLVWLGFGASVEAQTPRSYKAGKEAIEAKRWPQAEEAMRAAIAENPEAKKRTFSRYTPYYFLGVALAEQGDCRGALEAWQQTDRYGALRAGGDEASDLKKRRDQCSKLVGDVKKLVGTTREAIVKAEQVAASLERLSNQETLKPLWNQGDASFAIRGASAAKILDGAKEKLEKGEAGLDLDLLSESGYQAAEANRAFASVLSDAEARLAAVNTAVSGAMSTLDETETEARGFLRRVRRVAPYPPRLGAQIAKVRRVLKKIDENRDAASAVELDALAAELRTEISTLRPLAARPPSALREAGAAYLANEFQAVVDLLAEQTFRREKSRFHAGLLEAASLFGLYVMGGETDEGVMEQCRAVLRDLATMEGSFGAPGERFFPPRFRALYEEVRRELELAAAAEAGADLEDTGQADTGRENTGREDGAGVDTDTASGGA